MKKHNHDTLQTAKNTSSLIHKLQNVPLSNVPFHQNTALLTRYFAEQFPAYVAIHEISSVVKTPATYTQPHTHDDCDEINIILSTKNLVCKMLIGEDEHIVSNNTSVFIPRGMVHAANVLYGEGFYIAMRLT